MIIKKKRKDDHSRSNSAFPVLRWILFSSLALSLIGCGHNQIRNIYSGPERDDREVSALVLGNTYLGNEPWIAVVAGVDDVMCQFEGITNNNSPRPMYHCGNLVKILPGKHKIKYIVQTNRVSSCAPGLCNAWKRTGITESEEFMVEKAGLYKVSPRIRNGAWSVSIDPVCVTRKQFTWKYTEDHMILGVCLD